MTEFFTAAQPVWYLAHPLAPDDKYTVAQNMAHIVHLTRFFFDQGIYVTTPYHTCMLALDDTNREHRRMGIEMDLSVLHRLGRIICVGHKLSKGMIEELKMIQDLKDNGDWINLVGYNDEAIKRFCYQHHRRLTEV